MSEDDDDDVGHKKPPKQHQFKKGQSGNPKGRPRRTPDSIGEAVEKFSEESVSYVEAGRRKRASRRELSLIALRAQATKGNIGAIDQILTVLMTGGDKPEANSEPITVIRRLPSCDQSPEQGIDGGDGDAASSQSQPKDPGDGE